VRLGVDHLLRGLGHANIRTSREAARESAVGHCDSERRLV
jgi:hypothetical protein